MLRAVGARRHDVIRLVVIESAVIAALGGIIGLAGGLGLGALWMQVHFKYLFGWIMAVYIPLPAPVTLGVLLVLMTLAAASYPAWYASRLPVVRSVAHE